jgi:hypothetical protein
MTINKTKEELAQAINSTLAEVQDLLRKSDVLSKDDDMDGDDQQPKVDEVGEQQPSPDAPPAPPAGGEGEMPPAPPAGGEGEMPPGEGQPDQSQEMAQHVKELSDEELDMMLDLLMQEKEQRHAGQQQDPGMAPGGAPAPGAPPAPPVQDETMKSMKSEFASLAKSIADLKGDLDSLKKSQSQVKKPVVVTKPAATNNVQVLQKSEPTVEPLNKSDTIRFLETEQRRGNKTVNTDMIATVNACRDDSDLRSAQKEISKMGIKLPSA